MFVHQDKNPSFPPAFLHPLLSFMAKSLLCLLFVLCFVLSSQSAPLRNRAGSARSCCAPWEWVLCLLLALCKSCLSPILHLV